jgi:hypothetical protein
MSSRMGRETPAPDRNFTLATEDRVRAVVAGLEDFRRRAQP